jgi:tRNA/tmRNA/rRNA uracil-C5-methylase (TrmA/RlmC/RlmD family)
VTRLCVTRPCVIDRVRPMTVAPENSGQQQYWNEPGGTVWTQWQEQMDIQLSPLGDAAIEALALQPGERVLDIGCGCGHTTLQVAERVGPTGSVVGLDISEPMVARAVQRAAEAGLRNVRFVVGDAQVASVAHVSGPPTGGPVDAVLR